MTALAEPVFKICAVCGTAYTFEEFERLPLCTSGAVPDGLSNIEGLWVVQRQCAGVVDGELCKNTMARELTPGQAKHWMEGR